MFSNFKVAHKRTRSKIIATIHEEMTGDWIRGIMIVHCGKPIPSDIYRSKSAKFQLCITAFPSKGPCHICSLLLTFSKSGRRNNAKSAFQYTVNNNTI